MAFCTGWMTELPDRNLAEHQHVVAEHDIGQVIVLWAFVVLVLDGPAIPLPAGEDEELRKARIRHFGDPGAGEVQVRDGLGTARCCRRALTTACWYALRSRPAG